MKHLKSKTSCLALAVILATAVTSESLLASEESQDLRRFTFFGAIQGSASSDAQVNRLEAAVGYNFNRNVSMDIGLPFYFVNSNYSIDSANNGFRSGLGNAFMTLNFTPSLEDWRYVTSVRATAPTGNRDRGFSTGRATFDWNNFFSRSFSRLTPFANLGIANTVSDTSFFSRPFSSLGVVGHFEGGGSYRLSQSFSVGASAYSIVPSGGQKIYSRVVKRNDLSTAPGNGNGLGRNRAFETTAVVVDDSSLATDHGASVWFTVRPSSTTYLQAGYNRSVPYALNSFFFGIGFELDSIYRSVVRQ